MDVLEQRKHEAILFTFKQVRVLYQYCKCYNSRSCIILVPAKVRIDF